MTTISAFFRVALSALCLTFLAACGGRGDDEDIPAGAKACELKENFASRYPTYGPSEVVWDSGTVTELTTDIEGRHQVWFWPGPTYVQFNSSTFTLDSGGVRIATPTTRGIVPYDTKLSLAADLSYTYFYYAKLLGTKKGVPLIGSWFSLQDFGSAGAGEREPQADDVQNIQNAPYPYSFPQPQLTVMSGDTFQVGPVFSSGHPIPDDVKFDFFVVEDCYHCGKEKVWSCQVKDLERQDTVVITGAPKDQGLRFFIQLYATTVIDDGQKAVSMPGYMSISY
jgi:hypothetical protein